MAVGTVLGGRAELVARFKREAQLLRGLTHAGLPRVQDFFGEGGLHFLVQDYIAGENFQTLLARAGSAGLDEATVRAMALETLDILEYLHAQTPPVIHRDVKPANLMKQNATGRVVLVDFGIARGAQASTATAIGTAEYCAPEQYAGKAELGSDLYALGATMHHLLTGAVPMPFQFPEIANVSPEMRDVLAKATALNVRDRFKTA
ncbi:MAG: serine/threonine protein kinase, partial [Proteobacteria bacterium]|nr:serine/threonine protein kinase [Pseudomonadota bacterium]